MTALNKNVTKPVTEFDYLDDIYTEQDSCRTVSLPFTSDFTDVTEFMKTKTTWQTLTMFTVIGKGEVLGGLWTTTLATPLLFFYRACQGGANKASPLTRRARRRGRSPVSLREARSFTHSLIHKVQGYKGLEQCRHWVFFSILSPISDLLLPERAGTGKRMGELWNYSPPVDDGVGWATGYTPLWLRFPQPTLVKVWCDHCGWSTERADTLLWQKTLQKTVI